VTVAGAVDASLVGTLTEPDKRKRRLPLLPVKELLEQQRSLTAVERFARLHESPEAPLKEKFYRDLIPLEKPRPGEQYAFEVDLDACTGCKACVSACHAMNGLDESELWRTVGLLHGGTASAPAQQTVTTSCHHCLDPACMNGCPTKAYEKDPVTGIVRHLDDQCFGCQYCTLMCPFDAPKYNESKGIVRKCDMCSDRLAHGEAPACVQACPNGAIAIRVVEQQQVIEAGDAAHFLPGAPAPANTLPTTVYRTSRVMPNNMLPADFYSTRPEHSHPPLVVMLTLTQLSVGAFGVGLLAEHFSTEGAGQPLVEILLACFLALVALGASVFHLGRPLLAWRAVLGLRTSWLSREALAFGVFAKLALFYAALVAAPLVTPYLPRLSILSPLLPFAPDVRMAAALAGAAGVFCSVMVYVATKREQWSAPQTGVKFFGTTALLGAAFVFTVSSFTRYAEGFVLLWRDPLWLVVATSSLKLALESRALMHVRDRRHDALQRMAKVMLGELQSVTKARFLLLGLGGFAVPLALLGGLAGDNVKAAAVVMLVALVGGEFAERYLFFRAAPASRMPGGLR
jgi:formate dehydrogenase iron-sulfur subunit